MSKLDFFLSSLWKLSQVEEQGFLQNPSKVNKGDWEAALAEAATPVLILEAISCRLRKIDLTTSSVVDAVDAVAVVVGVVAFCGR